MPTLYLVATPIGNIEDITLRALRVLREVRLIAAEDTRKTRVLLKRYDITTPLASYHEQGRGSDMDRFLRVLADGDVALVSEAGMPGVSDPGFKLVSAAVGRGLPVVPIPGPSAILAALAASALPADQFVYVGFLPRRAPARRRFLASVSSESRTIVALEAPHRLRATLADLRDALGDRRVAVARELTKIHEEIFRGAISQSLEHFVAPRGEFTLVIEGRAAGRQAASQAEAAEELRRWRHRRPEGKTIAQVAAASGMRRRELYRAWLGNKHER